MKQKISLSIFLLIVFIFSICLLHTYVQADDTNNYSENTSNNPTSNNNEGTSNNNTGFENGIAYVNNVDELLEQIKISKRRSPEDTNIYKIILNRGEYSTDTRISVPSNICIDLNGNTINYTRATEALRIGPGEDDKDPVNVEIINGTISGGGLYCIRAQKVKLTNLTFNNCTSYGLNFKKSNNLELSYLEFNNIEENAISFEDCSIKILSHIICKNINKVGINLKKSTANNIENCVIQDTGSHGLRMYISHVKNIKYNSLLNCGEFGIYLKGPTQKNKNGEPIETESEDAGGIPIENNEFGSSAENIEHNTLKNCKSDGIGIYHGSWCKEIIYNELDTIGGNHNGYAGDYGIIIDSMMKAKTYCTRIAHNTIKNVTYCGIAIYSGPSALSGEWFSKKYQDTAYVEKNIENNIFINCGTYKHSEGWKNEYKQGCVSAIYIDTHALVKGDICNNTIETTGENGIYIHVFSSVGNIYNNTIKNCKEFGIHIYQNSTVRGNIANNYVYNCSNNAISVTKLSEVKGEIKSNNIDLAKDIGIYASESSITGIVSNKIKNVKNIGICLYSNAKAINTSTVSANISKNEIDTCGKNGIAVTKNSKLEGIISSNTIKNTGENGIYIAENSTVKSIASNNLKNVKKTGIYLNNKAVCSETLKNNNIYNCSEHGISVNETSTVNGAIKSNTIEKVNKNGIYIGSNSTIKNINNNTLKNIKCVGIYLNNKVTAKDILSNNISINNVKDGFGIKVATNSKVKNINSNKLDGKMIYGIRILGIFKNIEINSNNISTTNPASKTFVSIYVEGNKSYKATINKNKITGNKTSYGIRLAKGQADILKNTIKKTSFPIYVEKNDSAVKVNGNTISNNSKNLIRTTNEKVDINSIKLSSVKAKKGTKIKLNYKSSNKTIKFEIYQSTSKNATYKKIATLNTGNYTTSNLKKNKTYFYKIRGVVKDGKITVYTKESNIKSIKL